MSFLSRTSLRITAIMLACALLAPSAALAKPLTPERVHARIVKAGLGNFAAVQLQSGVAFGGRIVSIDDQSFSMQLHNDPQVTAVFYSDVTQLNTGISRATFWTIAGIGVGAVVAGAVIGFHEIHEHEQPIASLPPSSGFAY